MEDQSPWVVVIGGAGALGRAVVSEFLKTPSSTSLPTKRRVVSIDFSRNAEATINIILKEASERISIPSDIEQLSKVVCVAGSWEASSPIGSKDKEDCEEPMSAVAVWDRLQRSNVLPSLQAHALADKFQCPLVLTGASASLHACRDMREYGMAKAAVNMLAASSSEHVPHTLVLLPTTLDTPANRQAMPQADASKWTPLSDVAAFICQHQPSPESTASKVAFVAVRTADRRTTFTPIPSPF
jgi:dihydropteridine reductase